MRVCECKSEYVYVCVCVSYPGDIHDLDGCQLPGLNMATLEKGEVGGGTDSFLMKMHMHS